MSDSKARSSSISNLANRAIGRFGLMLVRALPPRLAARVCQPTERKQEINEFIDIDMVNPFHSKEWNRSCGDRSAG
jgi:hypothetical protein